MTPATDSEAEAEAPQEPSAAPKKKRGRPPRSDAQKAGEAKAAQKKAKRKATAKKAKAKPSHERAAARVAKRSTELKERAARGDLDAVGALKTIQKRFAAWNKALAAKAATGKSCGEQLKAADAAFANAVEAPLEVGKVEGQAAIVKLQNVEQRWQELSETKAGNIEEKKEARDAVKTALAALNKAIEDSTQLALPGMG